MYFTSWSWPLLCGCVLSVAIELTDLNTRMEIKSQGKAIEYLINAMPYSNQMRDIDLTRPEAVYFTWRSGRYKIELQTGSVDKVEGMMLRGEDTAILIRRLIELEAIKDLIK